ncbi:unnamed protein product [Camellia sinensis]
MDLNAVAKGIEIEKGLKPGQETRPGSQRKMVLYLLVFQDLCLTPKQKKERDARALQEQLAKKAAQGKNNNSVANNKNKK